MGKTRTQPAPSRDPLVGLWFHSLKADGVTVEWQGQILARTRAGYLVQLYEWVVGAPSAQQVVRDADLIGWRFYATNDQMNDWYEHTYAPRRASAFDRDAMAKAAHA